MKRFPKDKTILYFRPDNPAHYEVQSGETFQIEMEDCYLGQIKSERTLRPDIDITIMDAAVGPVRILGAEPGDILEVEVVDIELASQGVMVTSVGLGVLGDRITAPNTKIIPNKNGYAQFTDSIRLPLTPMIGVLGVSPAKGETHCATPGDFGGNLDTKEIRKGAKVYLPVSVPGANLVAADLHACMGDGELSGTGIEIAGCVTLKATVIKGKGSIESPVIETAKDVFLLATDIDFTTAMTRSCAYAAAFLEKKLALSFPDAYRLMSAACDIRVSQVVDCVITPRLSPLRVRMDTLPASASLSPSTSM